MTAINSLSTIGNVEDKDQLPIFDASAGTARKMSISQLLAFFASTFASPEFDTVISSPIAGFNQVLAATSKNIWLLLTPAGTLASGTVSLPPVAACFDGQEILVTSSQAITALTVAGNGATVNGAPGSIGANSAFRLRFNKLLAAWYILSSASSSLDSATFGSLTVTGLATLSNVAVSGSLDVSGDPVVTEAAAATLANKTLDAPVVTGGADITGTVTHTGNQTTSGNLIGTTSVRSGGVLFSFGYLVANLPAPVSVVGARAFVTDSNATLAAGIGNTVVGGGANFVPVFSNGSNWLIGG